MKSFKKVQHKKQNEDLNKTYDDQSKVEWKLKKNQEVQQAKKSLGQRKRKINENISNYFALKTTSGSNQLSKVYHLVKNKYKKLNWPLLNGFMFLVFHLIQFKFQPTLDVIVAIGPEFKDIQLIIN